MAGLNEKPLLTGLNEEKTAQEGGYCSIWSADYTRNACVIESTVFFSNPSLKYYCVANIVAIECSF